MSAKKKEVIEKIEDEKQEDENQEDEKREDEPVEAAVDGEADATEADDTDEKSGDDASTEGEENSIEDQLIAALKKADENWDQFLRTKAEIENLRRRNQKDVENAHKYGLEKLINEFIPIKEGIERGMAVEDATVESLHEGMQLTLNMINDAFEKMSVEEIDPKDEKFDPECHQAMTMQPTDEVEPNTVLEVLQKGYRINDRLIRPAMVIVSKAAE